MSACGWAACPYLGTVWGIPMHAADCPSVTPDCEQEYGSGFEQLDHDAAAIERERAKRPARLPYWNPARDELMRPERTQ